MIAPTAPALRMRPYASVEAPSVRRTRSTSTAMLAAPRNAIAPRHDASRKSSRSPPEMTKSAGQEQPT